MKLHNHSLGFLAAVLGGCLFSGEGTQGLPCNTDTECGGTQQCIEHVCGGPQVLPSAESIGSSDESGSTGDDAPMTNDDDVRTQCEASETQCLDEDTLRKCMEDGKLATRDCNAWCGQGTAHNGCQTDPAGIDICFCLNPVEECTRETGAYLCDGGLLLDCVDGFTVPMDCDAVCVDAGYPGGAESCGPGETGAGTCFCTDTCTEGATRCIDGDTAAECGGGSWTTYDCDERECPPGSYSRGCTYFAGDTEACGCWEL
jgi:hypothetical protein